MTRQDSFTADQQVLINFQEGVFVEACPGAGKTQSIVERFVRRPVDDPRRGVALVSFTNAAVDEARGRCSVNQDLLKPPNYIGTIDGFINRYITGPIYSNRTGRPPVFKDSWEDSYHSSFTISTGLRFELQWFTISVDGSASFDSKKVAWPDRDPYKWLLPRVIEEANTQAADLIRQHLSRGVLDCSYSRLLMNAYLADQELGPRIGELLRARFSEVIVDEIQDCSPSDVELFEFLVSAGVRVVMVGDLDQAIYNFRGSALLETQELTAKVAAGRRLSGNFRSSPAICSLVDSLRHGPDTDQPVGQNKDLKTPVLLMSVSSFNGHVETLRNACVKHGIDPAELLCLSHATEKARELAGDIRIPIKSRARLVRIAVAAATLRDVSKGATREYARAAASLTSRIRELHSSTDLRYVADNEFFERVDLTAREFRSGMLRVVYAADPFTGTAEEYRESILGAAGLAGWDWVSPDLLPVPMDWPQGDVPISENLNWSTVHGYKGLEAEAIALAIPAPPEWAVGRLGDGVACWSDGRASEARRVLYVGASRARRLAILVVDESLAGNVETILLRDQVPFERL